MGFPLMFFAWIISCNLVHAGPDTSTTSVNLTDTGDYLEQLTNLEKKLLTNYNRNVRPVRNKSNKTLVRVYPIIHHIEEVDELEQAITVHGYMEWQWKDEYLTWDKSEYNGLDRITIHAWYIWKPDIVLYNTAAGKENPRQAGQWQHAQIKSDGTVSYYPLFQYRVSCMFDFAYYPKDVQKCPLILGSWTNPLSEFDIQPVTHTALVGTGMWKDATVPASGWQLLDAPVDTSYWNSNDRIRTKSQPDIRLHRTTFTELNVWLIIKRHAPYFGVLVIAPAVVTSFFTLASFWTTNAIQGISILLINLIMQSLFIDDLLKEIPPGTGGVPSIVRFYAFNLIMTVLGIIQLMIFKSISNMYDTKREVPPAFTALVNSITGLNRRLGFEREDPIVEEDANHGDDEEEDEANRERKPPRVSIYPKSADWIRVGDALTKCGFVIYAFLYIILMFAWLC